MSSYDIYGIFSSYLSGVTSKDVYAKCFDGFGFDSCVPVLPTDSSSLSYLMPYLIDFASISGITYCTQCCGDPPNYIDTWDMYCPVTTSTILSSNVFGYNLYLARNRDSTDTSYISCPLRRSICTYSSSGDLISCDFSLKKTYLIGYTLTISVDQYDKNFNYWRGASSCEITATESNKTLAIGDYFHEKIIMVHKPISTFTFSDTSKVTVIIVTIYLALYVFLYFFRRKHCEYCQLKLVFSPRLCYKCVLLGAEPPDPALIHALEQKGQRLQGELPERFPGANKLTALLHNVYLVIIQHCCCGCAVYDRFLSKGAAVHPEVEIVATEEPCQSKVPKHASYSVTTINGDDDDDDIVVREFNSAVVVTADTFIGVNNKAAKKKLKNTKRNVNTLNYDPELIFKAVEGDLV